MSRFKTRDEFIEKQASEKITLATVDGKLRLYTWTDEGNDVYSRTSPRLCSGIFIDDTALAAVDEAANLVAGSYHYDAVTGKLSIKMSPGIIPSDINLIGSFRFFYASKSIQLTHDLQDISKEVQWEGRITSAPGYKHKIGVDQSLTSLVGEGSLVLTNGDGGLDSSFDRYIFENQPVTVYSWNPDLKPSQSKVIYRGNVTNKSYSETKVTFKIKDQLFTLLDSPQLETYTAADNVGESAQGQYKRRIYGRVDGLRCQSVDQIGDGAPLSGTVLSIGGSTTVAGVGTAFLSELKQGDKIIVDTQELEVLNIQSDFSLTLSSETDYGFTNRTATFIPENGTTAKNRVFQAAGHACAEVSHAVVNALQLNRVQVDSTEGLFAGDFIEFVGTGERLEIKTIAPGNVVVLQQSMISIPTAGSAVIRRPVQEVYVRNQRVNSDDYTIQNTPAGCFITLDSDVEFNLVNRRNTPLSGVFMNGSRQVTVLANEVSIEDIISPGDFIKPGNLAYSTFYKVVSIDDETNVVSLSENFNDPSITDTVQYKRPEVIEDDTIVSVNILGKTADGTISGEWIQTAAQAQKDILTELGISQINEQSFTDGSIISSQLISIAVPENFSDKKVPTAKSITDKLNKSVRSALTLDNDLLIKYQTLNVFTESDMVEIADRDVKSWSIKSTNGQTYRNVNAKYRFTDVELITQGAGNKIFTYESEFVKNYIGTQKIDDIDLYLYEERDVEIAAHRHLYYNRLGRATLKLTTDLRLENLEIGQPVILDFERLYSRYGDQTYRKKVMLIVGKTLTGESTQLELSDLGNTFNSSSIITPNDAPDYSTATPDEKLLYGFITQNNGITDDDEDSAGIHLIS